MLSQIGFVRVHIRVSDKELGSNDASLVDASSDIWVSGGCREGCFIRAVIKLA